MSFNYVKSSSTKIKINKVTQDNIIEEYFEVTFIQ